MNALSKVWRRDEGSIDFMQVVVGLIIIGVAAVGTLQGLYYGYQKLDGQMRYRKALSLARSYGEYWQGRIHVDMPNDQEMAGNLTRPKVMLLDRRNPNTDFDDIWCDLSYGRINEWRDPNSNEIEFYDFWVTARWWEPGETTSDPPNHIDLHLTAVPADL